MSFFTPNIPIKEKVPFQHPWEKYIKDEYIGTYKYGHNSANNPVYPPKKQKVPSKDRVKFTVIGNRVSKEYIYCINLVKGLHKHRWRHFDVPVIRGVTSVEWPKVWNDLKIQYGGLAYCLQSQVAILMNNKFLGGDKELKEHIESKYVYHIRPNYYNEAIKEFANFIRSSSRPCAYLHISVNDSYIGTMIFMLYADIAPRTCENFLRLCKTNKGGYAGTPIHRIVKDCWIQCGGFGIKNTELDCENFIVPHDRRGVLGMANDGRHVDCSTQFFVLLQPAQWMAHKYVAFGQLIDGEETLQKIEKIPAWYESPTNKVIIFKAGVLNMEGQDIIVNKGTNKYIHGHIENLVALGELFYEELLEKVFLEAEFRSLQRSQQEIGGEGAEEAANNLRATQRFMRRKEEIDKQIERSPGGGGAGTSAVENNDFDVEEYEYEPEEYSYKHVSLVISASMVVKPEKPFYIPLTDVPYPGEVDSTYDLKKLLKGDYCLESDIDRHVLKKRRAHVPPIPLQLLDMIEGNSLDSTESVSQNTLDSDDEREIKKYLKNNADHVSFGGDVVKGMAKHANIKLFENKGRSHLISDDALRRIRMAAMDFRSLKKSNVSLCVPLDDNDEHREIKRRPTGFVRPQDFPRLMRLQRAYSGLEVEDDDEDDDEDTDDFQPYIRKISITRSEPEKRKSPKISKQAGFDSEHLEKVRMINKTSSEMLTDDDDDESPRVRIAPNVRVNTVGKKPARRPTAFVRPCDQASIFEPVERQSVLTRLYDDVAVEDATGPTLKDYRPMTDSYQKNSMFLTRDAPLLECIRSDSNFRDKYKFRSVDHVDKSIDHVLNIQHGKQVGRKISSDYVKTIDYIEQKGINSIRSIEFAKSRPTLSVQEYQKKNQQYQEQKLKHACGISDTKGSDTKLNETRNADRIYVGGLRLPGDTPLYSMTEVN